MVKMLTILVVYTVLDSNKNPTKAQQVFKFKYPNIMNYMFL